MIDCEGRITPCDMDGSAYVLTYVCVTTGAPPFEGMASVRHADLRKAILKCVCLAETRPVLVAHDRGTEFVNALMEELGPCLMWSSTSVARGAPSSRQWSSVLIRRPRRSSVSSCMRYSPVRPGTGV